MAAPVGTVEIPVFIRFDGLEHQVGTIELDVMGEVTPQVKSAERAIAHALAPCQAEQAAPEDTAALPWGDATPYDPEAVHDALNMAARYGQLGALRLLRTIFHPDAWDAALQDPAPVVHLPKDEGPAVTVNVFAPQLGDGSEDYRTDAACAWTDYRNAYGVPEQHLAAAHKAFLAGWDAARGTDHAGVLR